MDINSIPGEMTELLSNFKPGLYRLGRRVRTPQATSVADMGGKADTRIAVDAATALEEAK